jgi:hypothetical protein
MAKIYDLESGGSTKTRNDLCCVRFPVKESNKPNEIADIRYFFVIVPDIEMFNNREYFETSLVSFGVKNNIISEKTEGKFIFDLSKLDNKNIIIYNYLTDCDIWEENLIKFLSHEYPENFDSDDYKIFPVNLIWPKN